METTAARPRIRFGAVRGGLTHCHRETSMHPSSTEAADTPAAPLPGMLAGLRVI
jgi:hypothetical protein